MFNGTTHYFDWAMFKSKLCVITRGYSIWTLKNQPRLWHVSAAFWGEVSCRHAIICPFGSQKWDTLRSWLELIAIENGHLYWVFPFNMVIFHSLVRLPEGIHSVQWMIIIVPITTSAKFEVFICRLRATPWFCWSNHASERKCVHLIDDDLHDLPFEHMVIFHSFWWIASNSYPYWIVLFHSFPCVFSKII